VSFSVGVIAPKATTVDELASQLEGAGQRVAARTIASGRRSELRAQLQRWIDDPAIDLVIGTVSSPMRPALLPLITKRLIGFSDLREIDGGRCESTIVILVPARGISPELLDEILERVARERRPRSPTQRGESSSSALLQASTASSSPLPSSTASSSSSLLTRRGPTSPPPMRGRPKTAPPPLPDFVRTHGRPPEAEFDGVITSIRPIRLERVPLVVSPTPKPPPKRHRRVAVGIAMCAGALVGVLIAWLGRQTPDADPTAEQVSQEPALAQPAPSREEETIEMPPIEMQIETPPIEMPPIEMESKSRVVPSASQVWSEPRRTVRCGPVFCAFTDFVLPCCRWYHQPKTESPEHSPGLPR